MSLFESVSMSLFIRYSAGRRQSTAAGLGYAFPQERQVVAALRWKRAQCQQRGLRCFIWLYKTLLTRRRVLLMGMYTGYIIRVASAVRWLLA